MQSSRFFALLVLVALLVAPFGRMAAAEAMPQSHGSHQSHGAPMQMAGHCNDMPRSDHGKAGKAIDCMIACATLAPAEGPTMPRCESHAMLPEPLQIFTTAGISPAMDPPPPRFS